ncbi:MAG: UbiA family prenyltransferase [Spirochaetota bacterium]
MMSALFSLTRATISLAVAASAFAGCFLCTREITAKSIFIFIGIALLAASASALNQIQERDLDGRMPRTKNRPLPKGTMPVWGVLMIVIVLGSAGLASLYFLTAPVSAIIGAVTFVWYNGMYTPLKHRTKYAIFIGAFTGALPPMAGWTAAGGSLTDPAVLSIALFMFLWQIPHFHILLLKYGAEYVSAGMPSMYRTGDETRFKRGIVLWAVLASMSALPFAYFRITSFIETAIIVSATAIGFVILYRKGVRMRRTGTISIVSDRPERFADRHEAGRLLARELTGYYDVGAVVLGIPRGGMAIAAETAKLLKARLDIVLTHKLGLPGNPEFAIGAIAENGQAIIDASIAAQIDTRHIEIEKKAKHEELVHQGARYRKIIPRVPLRDTIVIVIDDGLATGATMQLALESIAREKPKRLICAVPVASTEAIGKVAAVCDEVLCLCAPTIFRAVGSFYDDFRQITDDEVLAVLSAY